MFATELASVALNSRQCAAVAAILRGVRVPEDREAVCLGGLSHAEQGNLYFLAVAICHQTSPRGKPGLSGIVNGVFLKGWDYLLQRLVEVATSRPQLLTPHEWIQFTPSALSDIFGPNLSDSSGRTALIRDLGEQMVRFGWANLTDVMNYAGYRVAVGGPNLVDTLRGFRAFDDPVQKKTFFLLSVIRNSAVAEFIDPENILAPVDYHEVRGHLRLGTVEVLDPDLFRKIQLELPVSSDEDVMIRLKVRDAIRSISSQLPGVSNSQLHYLFWNVFRTFCVRQLPHCLGSDNTTLPADYSSALGIQRHSPCPFSTVCQSAGEPFPPTEHVFDTDYY